MASQKEKRLLRGSLPSIRLSDFPGAVRLWECHQELPLVVNFANTHFVRGLPDF